MTTLLVGFDSAWTPTNSGAIVWVLRADDGTFRELGSPQVVNYHEAENTIAAWQSQQKPEATIVLHVCQLASSAFGECGLPEVVEWLDRPTQRNMPRKIDQDGLDACICLLAALYLAEAKSCLMVGNTATGYIVVPYGENLYEELKVRCRADRSRPIGMGTVLSFIGVRASSARREVQLINTPEQIPRGYNMTDYKERNNIPKLDYLKDFDLNNHHDIEALMEVLYANFKFGRIDEFIEELTEHKDTIEYLQLSLDNLLNVLKLPAKDKDIFVDSIMQKLNLHSTDEPLVNYL
ncbi:MAG: hypothetical protein U5L00_15955 [Desulfovermiculus sp.]|nr:hypothetical protein [Desulfovermiculus sp.]